MGKESLPQTKRRRPLYNAVVVNVSDLARGLQKHHLLLQAGAICCILIREDHHP